MPADRLGQRREQELRLADPVGERGAVEFNAFAGVDDGLAVQRGVVAVLGDHHVRDQARPRPAAFDRQRRHRRLHNGLAGAAAQLRAEMADHLEAGGDVFEHLALVLADPAEGRTAAARAAAGRFVGDGLTWQVIRQWLADRLAAWAWLGRGTGGGLGGGIIGAGILDGDIFFEFADQQFELLDIAIELLRGAAEPRTPQRGELHLQLFDVQRLGMDLGCVGGNLDGLALEFNVLAR